MIDRELVTRKMVLIKVHEALSTAVADVTEYLDQVRRFLDRGAR